MEMEMEILLQQIQFPANVIAEIPLLTLIVGIITVLVYSTKLGKYMWGRWIQWDDHRTDARIQAHFGTYNRESLDKVIKDLCDSLRKSATDRDYQRMKDDILKLKGAVGALVGKEIE